ncbi:uncharacterized protein AB675_2035 [Cyphellophora attinorum]|uniref:Uncharacterized protein n=1 Tax=Cyphellophora attinorum TaxID=1664694 RepID=A0A0N1H863_9EURO|nr:uncharacterized protein AB675_2035 [Phialophora attinorum]KPI42955.1 hypothetical protein AB675_2035 [Phialophora attinorum]
MNVQRGEAATFEGIQEYPKQVGLTNRDGPTLVVQTKQRYLRRRFIGRIRLVDALVDAESFTRRA